MAISDSQKLDFLWKKLGYGFSKTETNSNKLAINESIASPLLLRGDNIWSQSGSIPSVQPGSSSSLVTVYPTSTPLECTNDGSASPNRTWLTGVTNWISPEFGATFIIKVYIHTSGDAANAASSVTQVLAAGSGNNDEWFFDYQSGVLNFNGINLPNGVNFSGKSVYIAGAVYNGRFGSGIGTDAQNNHFGIALNASSFDGTATDNVLFGHQAGYNITSGDKNVVIGSLAGNSLNSGSNHVIIGYDAGGETNGTGDVAIGYEALQANTGDYNTALGYQSGGGSGSDYGVYLGYRTGGGVTGDHNIAVGFQAIGGNQVTSGNSNICMGVNSGNSITSGSYNLNFGAYSGLFNTDGQENICVGFRAGQTVTNGDYNIFLGAYAGYNFESTSSRNIAIGRSSATGVTGSDNTIIGNLEYPSGTVMNGQVAIGAGATELIRINSTGVGIGITNPTNTLDVNGSAKINGNLTVDAGTNSTITVKCDDTGAAGIRLYGDSQGTGYVEVGQSATYGGGMSYNGDGSPAFVSGETSDAITFYNLNNGARSEVFSYPYNSTTVTFNGTVSANSFSGNGANVTNVNATTLDSIDSGSFLRSDVGDTSTQRISFQANATNNWDTIATSSGSQGSIEVYNSGSGNDAFMSFHTGSDYALYFGLDADTNDLSVGGWSMGANKYRVWHAGNDGSGSGLDADLLDGAQPSVSASNSTIVQRHSSGYIYANYFNTTPNDVTSGVTKVLVETGDDGFMRHGTAAAIQSFVNCKTNSTTDTNQVYIRNNSPTLYLRDTDHNSAMVHCNSDLLYILRGADDSTTWTQVNSQWPFIFYLTNNNAKCGNNFEAVGDVTAFSSDRRLKENFKHIDSPLEKVLNLNGYNFDWKDKVKELGFYPNIEKNDVGLIAQEVQEVIPQAVAPAPFDQEWDEDKEKNISKSGEDYLTVKYEKLVPLLVEAIKEQQQQIDELRRKLEEK